MSRYVVGDANRIKLEPGYFDYVVAIRCYTLDIRQAFKVLKPGGKVYISNCGEVSSLNKVSEHRVDDEKISGWLYAKPVTA